ncbi:helix-turn-helix domain-containing protein [Desulfurivibrio alkaliphilus]|uniref:Transcriptional regulator, XRE family n=1 Tax=Desulfurivibrio alkaliphilus (strain DSM 19089 / UNIQEM U267 / AHT2) TaxID=589865 RepID=D6Z2C5_DESAT|nr:helix-turn-helix transcriptional regulator [Desulfurivibrio alkaliphilus]ADH85700.1 transcriptional regulator, XRE family [Desulfurivibrio alkaliphilus AHT 2]
MHEQIIITAGGERLVVIPEADYLAMLDAIEDREDIAAIEKFHRRLAAGEEELLPAEMANRILDGENKIRVWREYRGMSARELASTAQISTSYLSQVETGSREGGIDTLKRIAAALRVSIDDLV